MNIHIIGAGVVGLTTAYVLAREGHDVTVVEERSSAAQEASFAPAGLITRMHPALWPSPAGLRARLGLLSHGFPTLDIPLARPALSAWARRQAGHHAAWLAEHPLPEPAQPATPSPAVTVEAGDGTTAHALDDTAALDGGPAGGDGSTDTAALDAGLDGAAPAAAAPPAPPPAAEAEHDPEPSLQRQLAQRLNFDLEGGHGHLIVLRDRAGRERWQRALPQLHAAGVAARWLEADEVRGLEPGIQEETPLAGAVLLPEDEVGNCRQFALALRAEAQRLGVNFLFNRRVASIEPREGRTAWSLRLASGEELTTEHLVLCNGAAAPRLLQPLRIALDARPLHGYTWSAALREPLHAPRHAMVTDAARQASISRMGHRIRVSGAYRLGVHDESRDESALREIHQSLTDWFPGAASRGAGAQMWRSTVLQTASGQPIVGSSERRNLWFNLGHGLQGWSQCLPCASLLAGQLRELR
ncbi:FAD-dependent oxidoreductase [Comamonadaceae bacterium PP-2]